MRRVYQTDRCACLQCSLTKRASGCGYGERSTDDHSSTCEKHLQALLHLSLVHKWFQSKRHIFQHEPVAWAALMDGDVEERLPQLHTFLSNPYVKSFHYAMKWFRSQAVVLIAAAVLGLFPEKERAVLPSRRNTSVTLPRPPRPQSTRQCQILSNQDSNPLCKKKKNMTEFNFQQSVESLKDVTLDVWVIFVTFWKRQSHT